jgi:hypothetical protein
MPTEELQSDGTVTVTGQAQPAPVVTDGPPASWDEIFKHPRIKEALQAAKDAKAALAKRDAEQAAAEDEKLKLQGEHEKRAEKLAQELQETKALLDAVNLSRQHDTKRRAVEDAARQHEPAFVAEAIPVLLRMVELDELPDDDTLPKAVQDAVKALAKANPYMLQTTRSDPGSPPGRRVAGPVTITGTGKPMGI